MAEGVGRIRALLASQPDEAFAVQWTLLNGGKAFISGAGDFVRQWYRNRFRCMPRNISLLISADGHYNYCFNDIRQSHHIGHVSAMSVREALEIRERSEPDAAICDQCNLRHRYGPRELARVAVGYVKSAVAA